MARSLARGSQLALLLAWLAVAAQSRAAGERLRVVAPSTNEPPSLIAWIEVRGRAGSEPQGRHDLVLALDLSESTLVDSGYDLDGDGRFPEGKTSQGSLGPLPLDPGDPLLERLRDLDLEDSILMAEIEAAEALVSRLDLETTRVGIVLFSDRSFVLEGLVSDRYELEEALRRTRGGFHTMLRGTNFAAALSAAVKLLDDPETSKSIVFLSDGQPTRPLPPYRAYQEAISRAWSAARRKIRIYPFALGPEAVHDLGVYEEIAEITGGRVERLSIPAEVVPRLGALDLAGLASVSIANLTTGRQGEALRTFPNGTFDGLLKLAPGENRIRIDADLTDGESVRIERVVRRLDPDSLTPEQAALARSQLSALLEKLRVRSMKLELWAEMQRSRRKSVEIEVIEPGEAPPE